MIHLQVFVDLTWQIARTQLVTAFIILPAEPELGVGGKIAAPGLGSISGRRRLEAVPCGTNLCAQLYTAPSTHVECLRIPL